MTRLRSLLRTAEEMKHPNCMTLNYCDVTITNIAEAMRRDPAWKDLNSDEARRERAIMLKYLNACVVRGVVSDWKADDAYDE